MLTVDVYFLLCHSSYSFGEGGRKWFNRKHSVTLSSFCSILSKSVLTQYSHENYWIRVEIVHFFAKLFWWCTLTQPKTIPCEPETRGPEDERPSGTPCWESCLKSDFATGCPFVNKWAVFFFGEVTIEGISCVRLSTIIHSVSVSFSEVGAKSW